MTSGLFGRGSRGQLCPEYSSEDKERGWDQGKIEGWETKNCWRGEKEKTDEVPPTTTEQGTSRECHSFGEHQRFPDCENWMQREYLEKWGEAMAF